MKKEYEPMYNLSVCGGTFDRLHAGHKAFLRYILAHSKKVMLGVTSDAYVRKQKQDASFIASFAERKAALEDFLKQEHTREKVTIASIDSVFYPSEWELIPLEAIFVTNDSRNGAMRINEDRKKKGLPLLDVVVVPMVSQSNKKLSSSTLRTTHPSLKKTVRMSYKRTLLLPQSQRIHLQKPFGNVIRLEDMPFTTIEGEKTITVGDVVTKQFNERHVGQRISVVDFIVQRKPTYNSVQELGFSGEELILSAKNPAGYVTVSLWDTLEQAFSITQKRIIVRIYGEEDLAVLPLVLLAPLGTSIFYGQPHQGVVQVIVSKKTKENAYDIISKFEPL